MTASQEVKSLGFKSLNQVVELSNFTRQALWIWHRDDHKKFLVVVHGCLQALNKDS